MRINIFWFRRDLRLDDNHALFRALADDSNLPVLPIFIFDRNILDRLPNKNDPRVTFIHDTLQKLKSSLQLEGSDLYVYHGDPIECWKQLLVGYELNAVFANADYEPYAIKRDAEVADLLSAAGLRMNSFKDQVIFEKTEIVKNDGKPYTVFTPYKRKWMEKLDIDEETSSSNYLDAYPSENLAHRFLKVTNEMLLPTLESMGFTRSLLDIPSNVIKQKVIREYHEKRNFPAIRSTSRLGIHFRFGTISIREKARKAHKLNKTFLNELIWRDFYAQILYNFPHVAEKPFRSKYERIPWRNDEEGFERWKNGTTGYSLVDAGMRELRETGFMHNRVRMLTASFLTKHLLIDWRWGEQHFADLLLDFDLASNNGGWQWAAGCGTDAAPYFRIFNPMTQQQKFDKDFSYVKQFVPEFGTEKYPAPIVDHKEARKRCLETYKEALS